MKKYLLFLSFALIATVSLFTVACEEEEPESCVQEEICDDKTVAACCTTNENDDYVCVYKYDGTEYPESEIETLADVLGCSTTKSTGDCDKNTALVITRLQSLMEKARCN